MTEGFKCIFFLLIVLFSVNGFCIAEPSQQKVRVLYTSLDPLSIVQHLAFYELYPDTNEGKQALNDAWRLMGAETSALASLSLSSLDQTIHALINLIDKHPDQDASQVNEEAILEIKKAAASLENRKLKGHYAKTEAEVLALPPEEIDLAHAIFLHNKIVPHQPWKLKEITRLRSILWPYRFAHACLNPRLRNKKFARSTILFSMS